MEQYLASEICSRRRKILIVDDNETDREILKDFLRRDYDIAEASDGNEAYAVLETMYREIDIVILDLLMPNCDGVQFLKKVKDNHILFNIPVVVLTASIDEGHEEQCLSLGAVDFLAKPFNPAVIKARLRNIIRMKELTVSLDAIEFDELTGLYTKQAFFYHAKLLLDSNPDVSYQVVIADVENFKMINMSYGMSKGNELIKSLADYTLDCCPDGICGCFGSDQIISMYRTSSPEEDDKYRDRFEAYKKNAPIPNIVIKYGIYQNVDRSLSISDICDRALFALESVKHNYNRTSAKYDGPLSQYQLRGRIYETRFQEAIQNKEFVVWYQPKYDVDTQTVVGAEALVRWNAPDRMINPGEFLGVFESNGLISQLDEYVFRLVCEYQKKRKESGCELIPISVNLSRGSLFGADVVQRYKKIVEDCGIEPQNVPIEITESAAIENYRIKDVADAFSEAGFCLHMDDFGSDRSSLNGLNVLHFDVVKLDKSLVDCIGVKNGELILEYTMALAKALGLRLVAEGVEDEKQFEFLKENGCDVIQGYYFSKPLPIEEFERKVVENHETDQDNNNIKKNYSLLSEEEIDKHAMVRMSHCIPGGFFSYEAQGDEKILSSNSYVWNLFGCDSEEEFLEYVHGSFKGMVCPEDLERVQESIACQIESNKNSMMDYVKYNIIRKDGRKIPVVDYGQMCYQDGMKVFYVFISKVGEKAPWEES